MVKLRPRKRQIRGDQGYPHETMGLKRILCTSQVTIPNTAGMTPDPAGNSTDPRSSKPDQGSRTPTLPSPLVSSLSFSSSSPISLFLVHISTIIARTQS
jgi:hypothetical protein